MKGMLENRDASPEVIFNDTIQVTMSQSHFRRRPWKEEMFAEMDMQKSLDIYRERFADASDFVFIFVGNLEMDSMRKLVTTYLGSLPALNRNETWTNLNIKPPSGVIKKTINMGLEPKARVQINFTGAFAWSRLNSYKLKAMASVLRIKLREVLREDKGGTYGVGVNAFISRIPGERYRIQITFGCDPERVEELIDEVYNQIDSLKAEVVEDLYLNKVKQSQLLQRQKNIKENSFWLNQLGNYYFYNEDPRNIFKFEPMVEALSVTDIQAQAQQFLDGSNVITFILLPENSDN
jgi:zinc protease